MFRKILMCSILASFFAVHGSQTKDSFVIEVKRKGEGSIDVLPSHGSLIFYTGDPDEATETEQLDYDELSFNNPLTFPNSLISKGFKFVQIWIYVNKFNSMFTTFQIKPDHHYLITMPTITGDNNKKRKVFPDGSSLKKGSLCVTKTEI